MGMKRKLRRRLSRAEGRLRREGRRLASVLLCGALIVGNLSAVPVSVLADDDNDYTYEIEKTALQEALQTAVSEGNTVSEDLEFAGEHAEEYAELFEADGTLYELELPDEEIDEDDDRDKALDLRIFARIEGDIPVDEAYEIDGSEEIVFLLSNKTEETVTATICVDDLETETITVLPAASIPVEEESVEFETIEVNPAPVSRGISAGGSGNGGSGGPGASASEKTAETEATEEAPAIEITDAADDTEAESASIREDTDVTIVSGGDESDSDFSADGTDADTSDPEEEGNISVDPEKTDDAAEDTEAEDTGFDDNETTDPHTEDANTEDIDIEETDTGDTGTEKTDAGNTDTENTDTDGSTADTGSENTGSKEAGDHTGDKKEKDVGSEDDHADAAADSSDDNTGSTGDKDADDADASENADTESGHDVSGSGSNSSGNNTSDDTSESDITEDSEVSVLGSAISVHSGILLAAGKATDSDADETASPSDASPSDADKIIEGELYEAVRFEKYGAAAFVTTAVDLQLDQVVLVDYNAETDGVAVTVSAPATALPKGAELVVTLYDEDSDEYSEAAEAIDYTPEGTTEKTESGIAAISEDESAEEDAEETTASSGLAVLDISFMVAGEEVEPTQAVTVTIDASGILPEDADANSIEVQHLTESGNGLEATLVADAGDASDGIVDAETVVAEFTVESFSTFTLTWNGSNSLTIYCIDKNDVNKDLGTLTTQNISTATLVSAIAEKLSIKGYTFVEAVAVSSSDNNPQAAVNSETAVTYLRRSDGNWQYSSNGSDYTDITGTGGGPGQTITNYYIYFIYTADTGRIVLNLGNGNGVLQDSDYSGGSRGSGGTDLRYTVDVSDAANEDGTVTINLPSNKDLDDTFTVATTGDGTNITQDLGNEAAPYEWKLKGWVNIATGEYYDVTGSSVTTDVDLNKSNVFYADWIAESYDYGSGSTLGVDTSDFVKIEMFDYNELFNLYSTSLTQSGLTSESWADSGSLYSGILGDGSVLDKSFIFQNCKTNNNSDSYSGSKGLLGFVTDLYSGSQIWNWNNETTYNVWNMDTASDSPILNMLYDTSGSTTGVEYVGSGNYLFQVDDDGYYYFDSDKNGAAYNQNAQRFYLSNTLTTVTDGSWDGASAFFPYNEVGKYASISDGTLNYWFGMNVEMDFYLPNNVGTSGGNQYNGKDMVFEFSGDDDVWVYVDDELVLNVSGIHSALNSSINFSTGEYKVSKSDGTEISSGTLDGEDCKNGTHTMNVFYMERGAWDSNLSIKFNVVPRWQYESASAGTTKVTKVWKDASGNVVEDTSSCPEVIMGLFEKTDQPASAGSEYTIDNITYDVKADGYSYDSDGQVNAYINGGYLYILVDKQKLSESINWTYSWELLDESKTYEVLELTNLSNYKTSSNHDALQDYEYWSVIGYNELNGTVTLDDGSYSRTGGILKDGLKILLTDGAQNGTVNTSSFPTTYTGYVINSGSDSVTAVKAQFSQPALQNSSDSTKYTYGVTADNYISSTSVWTVELTEKYESFLYNNVPYYAPTFYLKDSSGMYLTIADSNTLTTSDSGTAFSYNSLGELNTTQDSGLKITIRSNGSYAVVEGRENATNTENVKIYIKQDMTSTGRNYTIINTLLPTITLKKVDSSDNSITLSGAEFTLANSNGYYYSYTGSAVTWVNGSDEGRKLVTDYYGTIAFTALPDGTYILTEITAPNGYNLLSSSITVEVADGVVKTAIYGDGNDEDSTVVTVDEETKLIITVKNTSGSALPETGGPGTTPFRLVGLLLTSCSAYLVYETLRRRRNCLSK